MLRYTEIMLLEFGIEIDANGDFTEIATNFVDRTGVIHPDPSGGIQLYASARRGTRSKWEIDLRRLRLSLGKRLLETPEDFLYLAVREPESCFLHGAIAVSMAGVSSDVCCGRVFRCGIGRMIKLAGRYSTFESQNSRSEL